MEGVPTLHDLADRLGVSTATVSRALNDKPGVGADTRRRVLETAREMQFRPDATARALTTTRTRTVLFGVHRHRFPPTEDPFYPHILRGLEETLADDGYGVMLVTLGEEELAAGPGRLRALQERRVDGVVLAGPDIPPDFIISAIASGVSVLLVDNALRETPVPCVLADDAGGSFTATRHLIETHGHRDIGELRGAAGWVSSEQRSAGFRAAMEAADLAPRVIEMSGTTTETGKRGVAELLNAHPDTTAVVAVNDAMAIGAIREARRLGRRVPEDLAVVGFDDISWAALADPPLTTVRVPTAEMGRVAARLLLDHWEGTLSVPSTTTLATELVIRSSCGCGHDSADKETRIEVSARAGAEGIE